MLNKIVSYFEKLSEAHTKVNHVPDKEIHFAYLEDQKNNLLPDEMSYPLVQFGHLGYTYSGQSGSLYKSYECSLTILDHSDDTSDAAQIERITADMEGIMDDFIGKIMSDRRTYKNNYLYAIDIANAKVIPIENIDDALYGCTVNFDINIGWCGIPSKNAFDQNKLR